MLYSDSVNPIAHICFRGMAKKVTSNPRIKIVVIGDSTVGKTDLVSNFIKSESDVAEPISRQNFTPPTIGIEYHSYTAAYTGSAKKSIAVDVQVWDTSGKDCYNSLVCTLYPIADAVMLVFDINNRGGILISSIILWREAHNFPCRLFRICALKKVVGDANSTGWERLWGLHHVGGQQD